MENEKHINLNANCIRKQRVEKVKREPKYDDFFIAIRNVAPVHGDVPDKTGYK